MVTVPRRLCTVSTTFFWSEHTGTYSAVHDSDVVETDAVDKVVQLVVNGDELQNGSAR